MGKETQIWTKSRLELIKIFHLWFVRKIVLRWDKIDKNFNTIEFEITKRYNILETYKKQDYLIT